MKITFHTRSHKLFCQRATKVITQQFEDILCSKVASGYVTFYQINKFFLNNFFIIDKMFSQATSGPQAVV